MLMAALGFPQRQVTGCVLKLTMWFGISPRLLKVHEQHPHERGDCRRRGNGLHDALCVQNMKGPDLGPAGLPEVEISL